MDLLMPRVGITSCSGQMAVAAEAADEQERRLVAPNEGV